MCKPQIKQNFITQEMLFDPKGNLKKVSDFKVGQVYEWLPTPHSRFKVSFYAEIIHVDIESQQVVCYMKSIKDKGFSTYLLFYNNWLTNMNRMRLVGMKDKVGHLLENKQLLNNKIDGFSRESDTLTQKFKDKFRGTRVGDTFLRPDGVIVVVSKVTPTGFAWDDRFIGSGTGGYHSFIFDKPYLIKGK